MCFRNSSQKSQGYGVPASYSLIGIAYNEKLVKTAPKAWTEVWKPEYRGKIGIPRASSNLGLGVLVIAAKVFGGSEDNLEPGWSKLQELKPAVGRSPTQLLQMLEREEIALAPIWNNDAATAAQKGSESVGNPPPGEAPGPTPQTTTGTPRCGGCGTCRDRPDVGSSFRA